MMVIMMVVVMIAGRLGHMGPFAGAASACRGDFSRVAPQLAQKLFPFRLAVPQRRTRLPRGVFGFSVHIHGFFRTLLQRESLHRLEGCLVFQSQLGIVIP